MRRGIIVEKNKKYVTLLTPDGQFLRTKYEQQDYEIGQEVTFPNESRLERKRAGFFDLLRLRPLNAGILSIAKNYCRDFHYDAIFLKSKSICIYDD